MRLRPWRRLEGRRDRIATGPHSEKKSVIISSLNAPITIWALSAAFITIGGTYFTSHKQCLRDADSLAEKIKLTADELNYRNEVMMSIIENAKSGSELKLQLNAIKPRYYQFKNKSIIELSRDLGYMAEQVSGDIITHHDYYFTGDDLILYKKVLASTDAAKITDKELLQIKNSTKNYGKMVMEMSYDISTSYMRPNCSAETIVESLFFSWRPKIIFGEPPKPFVVVRDKK